MNSKINIRKGISMTQHKNISPDNQHIIHRWILPTKVLLNTITPASEDLYKLAFVSDTSSYFILVDVSPLTWKELGLEQTDIIGNAGSSTRLQNARKINGVFFDGTTDITINAIDNTERIASSEKGIANGVATLDTSGLISITQLPSYVDDVLEYEALSLFPTTGVSGKIYVDTATSKTYRWSGTVYVYITSGAVDSVSGKTGVVSLVSSDVGLGNVDNTADLAKPISAATQTALNLKVNASSLSKSLVGLGNVDNTSDLDKPISTATQNALDTKAETTGMRMTGEITGIRETAVQMMDDIIDLAAGNLFTKTITTTITFNIVSVLPYPAVNSFILELRNGGSHSFEWFPDVKWTGGKIPALTTVGVDILGFYSPDGGLTWRGVLLSKDSK